MKNNQKNNKLNSTINNFRPKSINIVEISSVSSQKKPHSPHIYNTFFTNENPKKKYHNHNKFLNDFPFRIMGAKSSSTDKGNKTKSKFGQYKNYSKHYCITLNQYAQFKQNYLSLNSQSNSKSKSKSKQSRPSTAPQKNKNPKKQNNNKGNENKNNFVGFNGIVNIRTNLINNNNNKNNGINNNKKYKIKENKNNEFITLFNPTNTFTNNIIMNISNGFNNNNKFMSNIRNGQGNNKTLFGENNRRIPSSRIFLNQNGSKKQNNGERMRLSSAIVNNTIPFMNSNSNPKKRRLK